MIYKQQAEEDPDASFEEQGPSRREKYDQLREAMSPEEKKEAEEIDLRCLTICYGMLKRVESVRVFENPKNVALLNTCII